MNLSTHDCVHLLICVQSQITLVKHLPASQWDEVRTHLNRAANGIGGEDVAPALQSNYLITLESFAQRLNGRIIADQALSKLKTTCQACNGNGFTHTEPIMEHPACRIQCAACQGKGVV